MYQKLQWGLPGAFSRPNPPSSQPGPTPEVLQPLSSLTASSGPTPTAPCPPHAGDPELDVVLQGGFMRVGQKGTIPSLALLFQSAVPMGLLSIHPYPVRLLPLGAGACTWPCWTS